MTEEYRRKVILSDLGAVLLFSTDKSYKGKLNPIYEVEKEKENFRFFDYFDLNTELLDYYRKLKDKGLEFFIITEGFIQNDPAIKKSLYEVFSHIYSGKKLGYSKKDPSLYSELAVLLKHDVRDILYIDDSEENINAANEAGINGIRHIDNVTTIRQLSHLE